MKTQVRRAQRKDTTAIIRLLDQVLMLHHQGRPDIFKGYCRKYTDEQLEILIEDDTRPIFVATDETDAVLGYSFCIITQPVNSNILTDIKTLYIDDLCVDETIRGQHIGQTLYDYVKTYASEIGCYNLTLNVWACNENAMKFYEKQGMQMLKKGMETIL